MLNPSAQCNVKPFACIAARPVGAKTHTSIPLNPFSVSRTNSSVIIASMVYDLPVPAVPVIIIAFGIEVFGIYFFGKNFW